MGREELICLGWKAPPFPGPQEGEIFVLLIPPPFPGGILQSRLINLEGASSPDPLPGPGSGSESRVSPPPIVEGRGGLVSTPLGPCVRPLWVLFLSSCMQVSRRGKTERGLPCAPSKPPWTSRGKEFCSCFPERETEAQAQAGSRSGRRQRQSQK